MNKTQPTATATFQGEYVAEILRVLTASALSGQHCLMISPPGYGKTEITRAAAAAICGAHELWNFTAFTPSTPPSALVGIYDLVALKNGQQKRIVEGTAFDTRNRIIILDEFGRASEPVYDEALHLFDRKDVGSHEKPTIWNTANFVLTDERTEALRDRIGLWLHLHPSIHDVDGMLDAFAGSFQNGLHLALPGSLPTWAEIEEVRAMQPGPQAIAAIKYFIAQIVEDIAQKPDPLRPNPRHLRQWFMVLFRYGAWLAGTNDFEELHPEAKRIIRYAWVMPTVEEFEAWGKKTSSVMDLVGALIDAQRKHVADELNKLFGKKGNQSEAQNAIMKATATIQGAINVLEQRGGGDKRIKAAKDDLTNLLMKVIRGGQDVTLKDIFAD